MAKNDARTLSMLILLPPASAGAVIEYAAHNNIDWWMSGVLFVLYFVTNPLGAKVRRRPQLLCHAVPCMRDA